MVFRTSLPAPTTLTICLLLQEGDDFLFFNLLEFIDHFQPTHLSTELTGCDGAVLNLKQLKSSWQFKQLLPEFQFYLLLDKTDSGFEGIMSCVVDLTCFRGTVRVWHLDVEDRKINPTDIRLRKFVRVSRCIAVSAITSESIQFQKTVIRGNGHEDGGVMTKDSLDDDDVDDGEN